MVRGDVYPQPDAPDPVLGPEVVLAIVRRHAAGTREVTAVDESGGEARAYMIDGDLVLKTQRPHRLRARTSLEKEAFLLEHVAKHSRLSAPRVIAYGQEEGVEYLLMTRMPGAAARALRIEGAARRALLAGLGRALRELHSMPQEALRASPLMPGDRSEDDLRGRIEGLLSQALAALATNPTAWPLGQPAEAVAALLRQAAPTSAETVALHSNPGPEHVFVDPETLAFNGLIDFGDAYISHPALDLRSWPRPEDRALLLEGYEADQPLDAQSVREWRAVVGVADLAAIALRPDRQGRRRREPQSLSCGVRLRILALALGNGSNLATVLGQVGCRLFHGLPDRGAARNLAHQVYVAHQGHDRAARRGDPFVGGPRLRRRE